MLVHNPKSHDVNFNMKNDIFHYHDTKNRHVTLVQTVKKNEAGYSKFQIKSAKLARELYSKFGHISQKGFKNLTKSNIIRNCSVIFEDAIRSQKIYGPNISKLKRDTTRSNNYPVLTDYITSQWEIIKVNKNITISEGILFINNITFFANTSCNPKFTTITWINNRNLN